MVFLRVNKWQVTTTIQFDYHFQRKKIKILYSFRSLLLFFFFETDRTSVTFKRLSRRLRPRVKIEVEVDRRAHPGSKLFHFSTRFELLSSFLSNIRSVSFLNWHKAATCCNENVGYSDTGIWLWSGINQNCLVSTVLDTLAWSTHGHGVVGQALVLVGAEALGDHLRQVSWFVELHTVELAWKAFGCGFLSTLFHHRAAANVGRIWVPWIGSDWIGRNWIDEEKHHRQNGLKQKLIH